MRPLWHLLYDPEACCEFDLFQAVRLMQMLARGPNGQWPDVEDVTRFRANLSLAFPPSAIAQIVPPASATGLREPHPLREPVAVRLRSRYPRQTLPVTILNVFGLVGPAGALPTVYTEYLCDLGRGINPRDGDRLTRPQYRTLLRDWIDIFNHRLSALLYRAWEKYRFPVPFFRYATTFEYAADRPTLPDPFTMVLFSLVGLGTPALRNRVRVLAPSFDSSDEPAPPLSRVNDLALLHYAAPLARRRPTAGELAVILEDYFGVRVQVEAFTGQWLDLNPADQTVLTDDEDVAARLGVNAVAGERVWDAGSKFRVRVGPLHLKQYEDFLPDATPIRSRKSGFLLSQLVQLYTGPEFDFEVRLVLYGPEVPHCKLDEPGPDDLGVRLGWNTWLPSDPMPEEVDDMVYDGPTREELAATSA